jgi:hypothetical protein
MNYIGFKAEIKAYGFGLWISSRKSNINMHTAFLPSSSQPSLSSLFSSVFSSLSFHRYLLNKYKSYVHVILAVLSQNAAIKGT